MAETIFRQRRKAFPATAQADAWPRLRTGGRQERTAGRLTKPPHSGRGRACPSADARAAGFAQRPSGTLEAFGRTGNRIPDQGSPDRRNGTGGTPDLRIEDQPGRKRDLRIGALPPAQKGLRLRRGRAGPGFGPGAANQAAPRGFGLMDRQAEPEASARGSCRRRHQRLRPLKTPRAWKRNASSDTAERRTVRASALSGSHRGHQEGFGPNGLRRTRGQDLSWLPPLEKAHPGRPASAEPDEKGQWGPAAMPGPITVWAMHDVGPNSRVFPAFAEMTGR